MLFTSISFLYYFLPIVILLYFITPKKLRNFILFISSMLFYFYGEPKYILLMLIEILIAYISGILIDKYKSKSLFIITLIIHIGLFGIFKYTDFIISNINNIFSSSVPMLSIALPIGISFYTFQILSYEIDVYKGKVKVQKNLLKLLTYVSLFPQLIAGPIVRYETIEDELENRKHSYKNFSYGAKRFVIGLAKKVLIANILGELCNKFMIADEKSTLFYWIYGISYMLQIYFDFSAYSDMAIGLGKIFGFNFLENFDYPYMSKSITEFWRRWHISLGSWFRDYVYIPLGGNKKGIKKQIRNILVVWLLTGIWHGASWNFAIWGLMFGIILIIEKIFLKKILDKIPSVFSRIYVLFLVMISFIIFGAENLSSAINSIVGLFDFENSNFINDYTMYYLRSYFMVIIIAIIGATPLLKNIILKLKKNKNINMIINIFEPIYMILLLIITTSYLVDSSYNPFLYFRF